MATIKRYKSKKTGETKVYRYNYETLNVTMTEGMKRTMTAIARKKGMTLGAVARSAIRRGLANAQS